MFKTLQGLITAAPLIALPAVAAEADRQTGINSVGPAVFFFTVAAALLLTLVFSNAAGHLADFVRRRLGDLRVRAALRKHSEDVIHGALLPGAYGGLAKIDHVLLTAGGILCIQSKHEDGLILGGEGDSQWTKVGGRRRQRFLNPLIQNEGRARALRRVVPDVPVANLVIFTGKAKFAEPPPANVIHLSQLDSFVARFVLGPSKVRDWDAAWLTVKSAVLTDPASRRDFDAQLGFL